MIDQIKPLLGKLCSFSQEKMGFSHPPRLFLKTDKQNSNQTLGKTAHYDPAQKSVTIFIHGRHPKDILRSFAHELVHHTQNLRGDLSPEKVGQMGANYAQEDDHMRNMEKEAYLKGNMCFRDWEDTIEDKDKFLIKLAESKFLKENKTMTTKITKKFLKETITRLLKEEDVMSGAMSKVSKSGMSDEEYVKYAERNKALKGTDRYKNIMAKKKDEPKKMSGPEAFAQMAREVGALDEDEGLEVVDGVPVGPEMKPDLEIKPTLKDLIKMLEEEEMITMMDAIAKLKAELEAMELQAGQPDEPEVNEGSCGKRDSECVDESCPTHGKTIKEEEEEIEEASQEEFAKNRPPYDEATAADRAGDDGKPKNESKIQTPEEENTLYEQRFTPKNNRLFEKLVKQWTK
jgi:hypothetical protein